MTSKSNPGTNTSDQPSGLTVGEISRRTASALAPAVGGGREAAAMVRIIWEWLKGWDTARQLLHADDQASVFVDSEFARITARVVAGEPLQYVLGEAQFYGMTLEVSPDVLIPRPETAELVDAIVDRYGRQDDLRVLDVATGSGCIAVALARNLPFSRVTALDISAKALAVASRNASRLKAKVEFAECDILKALPPSAPCFDIVVSNPPYIAMSEKSSMDPRVVDHEPSLALFVSDSDPLLFYRAVARYAASALVGGGALFFEINPLFANELTQMLNAAGSWTDVELWRDSFGKLRFASARKAVDA